MKTLMLGWEFPPVISGGLGTACYGLTKAMGSLGIEITFVLPWSSASSGANVKMVNAGNPWSTIQTGAMRHVRFRFVPAMLSPYLSAQTYSQLLAEHRQGRKEKTNPSVSLKAGQQRYGHDIFAEVHRYAHSVMDIAAEEDFDIVHAHDWMTYPAGIGAASVTGKPLVVQVHSTEFDRCGDNVNKMVYDIERSGMHAARRVIAVSQYTKNIIMSRYGVAPEKVEVVHNGVEPVAGSSRERRSDSQRIDKVVLYMGRI
ncbi:MAG TPA: glycosyltransferase family 4 protein, partial [Sedimentisphaerales bacterium]|nr:glycosyltransferase family 4 protein [Sedimentisphaerales bacterium]